MSVRQLGYWKWTKFRAGPRGSGKVRQDRRLRPWPAPILADEREGYQILAKRLRYHATYVAFATCLDAFATSLDMNDRQNNFELMCIAGALDTLFYSLEPKRARREMAAEFMIRRMNAVMNDDETGDWYVAERVESTEAQDPLSHKQYQQYSRQLKPKKALVDSDKKNKPAASKTKMRGKRPRSSSAWRFAPTVVGFVTK